MGGPTVGPAVRVRVGAGSCRCCVWGTRRSTVVCRTEQDLTSSVFLLCSSLHPFSFCSYSFLQLRTDNKNAHTFKRLDTSAFLLLLPSIPRFPTHSAIRRESSAPITRILPVLPSALLPINTSLAGFSTSPLSVGTSLGSFSLHTRLVIPKSAESTVVPDSRSSHPLDSPSIPHPFQSS